MGVNQVLWVSRDSKVPIVTAHDSLLLSPVVLVVDGQWRIPYVVENADVYWLVQRRSSEGGSDLAARGAGGQRTPRHLSGVIRARRIGWSSRGWRACHRRTPSGAA
jgi:hypothetical protein